MGVVLDHMARPPTQSPHMAPLRAGSNAAIFVAEFVMATPPAKMTCNANTRRLWVLKKWYPQQLFFSSIIRSIYVFCQQHSSTIETKMSMPRRSFAWSAWTRRSHASSWCRSDPGHVVGVDVVFRDLAWRFSAAREVNCGYIDIPIPGIG